MEGEPLEATRNCETKFHDYKRKGVLLGDRNGVESPLPSLSLFLCGTRAKFKVRTGFYIVVGYTFVSSC